MELKRIFSFDAIKHACRQCARRSPVTAGFIFALTLNLLTTIWIDSDSSNERLDDVLHYFFAVGILLTTVLQLWGEEVRNVRTKVAVNVVAHGALVADSVYLYTFEHVGMEVFLMHASLLTALTLCMFILPFFRERDDIASWNFSLRILSAAASSFLIGCIMCGGVLLLSASVENLFGIDLSRNWSSTWCTLFLFTLPSLLFLGRIPVAEEKYDRTPLTSPFLNKIIHYLFLPLLGCYLWVLYAYLAKILFQWQLPDGWVSTLVSALVFCSVAIVLVLYPSLCRGTSRTDRRVVRFLPLAILPLLVLMTVGISRRLMDYGITVNRLYLLTLNLWFYLVCLGLFLSRARRVWWISASFAAVFLLTSVLPINITSYTRNWMRRSVQAGITATYKGSLPMSEEAYYDWLATLPVEKAHRITSRFKYLDSQLRDTAIHALVSDSVNWWKADSYTKELMESQTADKELEYINYHGKNETVGGCEVTFDAPYTSMLVYTNVDVMLPRPKTGLLTFPLRQDNQPVDTIQICMDDLRKWDALNNFTPRDLACRRKGGRFVLTGFRLYGYPSGGDLEFTYSGFYLMRPQPQTSNQLNIDKQ